MIIEMSCKKRWLSKIYSDSQESRTDTDISWSNSDSDQDSEEPPVKTRIKVTHLLEKSKSKNWIKVHITPPKKNSEIQIQQTPSPRDPFLESPIISAMKLEDRSPVLTQPDLSSIKEHSPIISRSKIVRRIKWRSKRKKEVKPKVIQEESLTQSTLIIDSPSQPKTQIEISPAKSEFSQPYRIDPFPSQHSSEVVSDSFTSSASEAQLYHHPHPRRKTFKKGGLASQLQKVINLQNTSTAIWQHEVFLSKSKGEEIHQANVSDGIEFEFFVIKKWKEYGCPVLECRYKNGTNSLKAFSNFAHLGFENFNSFLVLVGSRNPSNVCFECNHSYHIFPPYNSKVVIHELKRTFCIINAARFISL